MRIQTELQQELASRGFTSLAQAVSYAHREADIASMEEAPSSAAEDSETEWDFISE